MTDQKIAHFYSSIEPLDRKKHAEFGLNNNHTYTFAKNVSAVAIAQNELISVSSHYPIIFVGDSFVPAAALGTTEANNLFIDTEGKWADGHYIPSAIRRYPFILAMPGQNLEPVLSFDPNSESIAQDNPDIPFFKDGEPSEMLEGAIRLNHAYDQGMKMSKQAVDQIKDLDLFCTKVFSFTNSVGETQKIQFNGINDELFEKLTDEEFLSLKNSPALDLIFAHRFSLNNWNKLVRHTG